NPPQEFLDRATHARTALPSSIRGSHSAAESASQELRYDGEVMYADAQLARIIEWMGSHGLADQTMIILAGDHGEGLGEHGERTHGMLVYDSTLRVPLIVVARHDG